jgi:hypothetical protein
MKETHLYFKSASEIVFDYYILFLTVRDTSFFFILAVFAWINDVEEKKLAPIVFRQFIIALLFSSPFMAPSSR